MIMEGTDDNEITLFELIFSILNNVRCVSAYDVEQLVGIVGVKRVLIAVGGFGNLVLVKDAVSFPDTVV
jgi:hypothetical protein